MYQVGQCGVVAVVSVTKEDNRYRVVLTMDPAVLLSPVRSTILHYGHWHHDSQVQTFRKFCFLNIKKKYFSL